MHFVHLFVTILIIAEQDVRQDALLFSMLIPFM